MSAHPSERLASLSRAALCLGQALGALASVACDFPVDASKYQVQEASSPLLELFSDSADCLVQLENACSDPARDCEAISGCSEFTECVRAEASPAGTAYCRSLGDTSLEAQWGYENLRGCWAKEFSACTIGEDLSCQGYRPPATQPRPELLLGQRLTYLAGQKPGDTFDLSVCGLALGCAKPVAQAKPTAKPVAQAKPTEKLPPKPAATVTPGPKPVAKESSSPATTTTTTASSPTKPSPAQPVAQAQPASAATTAATTAAKPPAKAKPVIETKPVAEAKPVAETKPVIEAKPVPEKALVSVKPAAAKIATATAAPSKVAASKPKGPDWRSYGPLQVDWANWQPMGGSFVAPTLNGEGKPVYLAVNCGARKLNATSQSGQWKSWDSPQTDFEKQLITDICKARSS